MIDRTYLAAAAGFIAMVGVGFIHAAHAAPAPQDTMSVRISLAGVNLSDAQGASVALQRIHAATRQICGAEPSLADLDSVLQYRACVNSTANAAVANLDAPMVTALNEGRSPDEAFASGR